MVDFVLFVDIDSPNSSTIRTFSLPKGSIETAQKLATVHADTESTLLKRRTLHEIDRMANSINHASYALTQGTENAILLAKSNNLKISEDDILLSIRTVLGKGDERFFKRMWQKKGIFWLMNLLGAWNESIYINQNREFFQKKKARMLEESGNLMKYFARITTDRLIIVGSIDMKNNICNTYDKEYVPWPS